MLRLRTTVEGGYVSINAIEFDPSQMKTKETADQPTACEYTQTKSDLIQFCGGTPNLAMLRIVPKHQALKKLELPFDNMLNDSPLPISIALQMVTRGSDLDGGYFWDVPNAGVRTFYEWEKTDLESGKTAELIA